MRVLLITRADYGLGQFDFTLDTWIPFWKSHDNGKASLPIMSLGGSGLIISQFNKFNFKLDTHIYNFNLT